MLPPSASLTPVLRRLACIALAASAAFLLLEKTSYAYDMPAQISPEPPVGPNTPISPVTGGLQIQAVGTESGTFDSNPLMLQSGAKALWGSVTAPELILNDSTPTVKFTADTTVDENLYNLSEFNSTDLHSTADFLDQQQRWSAEIQEHTDYDTTRTSELTTFGLNQQQAASVRHLGFSVAPQIAFSPTAIDRLSLTGSGQVSTYDGAAFTDYGVLSITPSYSHNFGPLNAAVFSVQAQRYSTLKGANVTVDSIAPTVGWKGVLTPRLTADANIGIQTVSQYGSGTTSQPWSINYVFSGDVAFRGEQDTTNLNVSRSQYPFSNGTESLLTTITIAESHVLNQKFSLNIGGSYQSATYQTTSTGSLDSIMNVNGGLAYHATDRIDLTAGYQYRYETLIGVSGAPQDHTGTIGIVYRPKSWKL